MIEYQGIEKYIYNSKILQKKRILKHLSIESSDITIIKVDFKNKLLQQEKFLEIDGRVTYWFHVYIGIDIYYLTNLEYNELGIISEEIYDSYLLKHNNEDSEYGEIAILEGFVKEYPDNGLCVIIELALMLGGIKSDS